jgi:hypothetical protein
MLSRLTMLVFDPDQVQRRISLRSVGSAVIARDLAVISHRRAAALVVPFSDSMPLF